MPPNVIVGAVQLPKLDGSRAAVHLHLRLRPCTASKPHQQGQSRVRGISIIAERPTARSADTRVYVYVREYRVAGVLGKAALIGECLSPYVGVVCLIMGINQLFQ